jgi:hypothetical protein
MKASSFGLITSIVLGGTVLLMQPVRGVSETIASGGDASVSITDVKAQGGAVSGMLVNRSQRPVHDVRVLVRYIWHWNNERHPGEDSPGRAEFSLVPLEIPPGGSVPFAHDASPPLPERTDGHFTATAEVVGFTEVGD